MFEKVTRELCKLIDKLIGLDVTLIILGLTTILIVASGSFASCRGICSLALP